MDENRKNFKKALEGMVDMMLADDSIPVEMKIDYAIARQASKVSDLATDIANALTIKDQGDMALKKATLEYLGMVEAGIRSFVEANNIDIGGE